MNILILAAMDCSGAGHALMTAINEHTEHKARMAVGRQVRYQYPADIVGPTKQQMRRLVEWADAYNFHVRGEEMLPRGAPEKPTVKTYHGSGYRKQWRKANAEARAQGWTQTCLTIDLSAFGPTWIGRAMPDLAYMRKPADGFHVVHAGAPDRKGKRNRKGTDLVEQAEIIVKRTTFDIFREVPNEECLQRKAWAHLYVDQVGPRGLGYGTNALEAWAMGLPVIASAPPATVKLMRKVIGRLPFCPCYGLASLKRRIEQMRDDKAFRKRWAAIGRWYVQAFHAPELVAARYVTLFKR